MYTLRYTQVGIYTSLYTQVGIHLPVHPGIHTHPGYTLVYHPTLLMHAATQWSLQCRTMEPWAQTRE